MSDRFNVALIFGGDSPEHGVSCLTAASVLAVLNQDQYQVIGIGITRTGRWVRVPLETIASYRIIDGQMPEVTDVEHEAILFRGIDSCQVAVRAGDQLHSNTRVDVAFTLLHGPYGEDGTIQGLFEMLGLRYVGSGVSASALGMDKQFMRIAFEAAGISVSPYVVFDALMWRDNREDVLNQIADLAYPLFVKPARGGSSVGIRRVSQPADLLEAIAFAQSYDPKVVVEQGVIGREVECAVLGAPELPGGCIASKTGEIRIVVKDGFYDFEAKYIHEADAELDIPAQLDEAAEQRVRELAIRAYRAIGCEGLARVDSFVKPDGSVLLNEINTMPGFTAISMYPALWQATGITYPELVDRLIKLALARPIGLR